MMKNKVMIIIIIFKIIINKDFDDCYIQNKNIDYNFKIIEEDYNNNNKKIS